MDVVASQRTAVIDDVLAAVARALGGERAVLVLDAGASRHELAARGFTEGERADLERSLCGDATHALATRVRATTAPLYVTTDVDGVRRRCPGLDVRPADAALAALLPAHLVLPLAARDGAPLGTLLVDAPPPRAGDLTLIVGLAHLAALAIEEARTATARAGEVARADVLFDVVREVDRPVELPEVLAAICRKTAEAFAARQATVYYYSRRHRASLPLADYGTPLHVVPRFVGGRYMAGNIPHEDEVRAGRTVVIARDDGSPADAALLDLAELAVLVMVPLRNDDGTVRGTLTVGFSEPRVLTADDLRTLDLVAHHAAAAIMRARFLHRTAQSARFRAAVSALAVELNAATSRADTVRTLCARGCEIVAAETAVLLLDGGDRLVAAAACGELAAATDLVVALDDRGSPAARAFRTAAIVLEGDRPRRDDGAPLERLRSLLAIPLVESDGPVGVLVFGARRPRRFRPDVVDEAPLLAAVAAAALRNGALMGELQASNQRLGRLSALKDQFLANVSHDLRTPLSVIIGFAQLALEGTFGDPPAMLREILERMLANARQQLTLVQDLLDVSRLELNGLSVKVAPLPLAALFADMDFLATTILRHKPVRAVVEAPADDLWVRADGDRLRQILTNLLTNAAKFTDAGTIALRATASGGHVRIDVSDTGIGIPAHALEYVFEPFRQVEGERAILGTGLGLAISRRLAQLMDGALAVASTLGRGSTFTLTLPAARPDDAATHADAAATPAPL